MGRIVTPCAILVFAMLAAPSSTSAQAPGTEVCPHEDFSPEGLRAYSKCLSDKWDRERKEKAHPELKPATKGAGATIAAPNGTTFTVITSRKVALPAPAHCGYHDLTL